MSLNWSWDSCCGEAVFESTYWNPLEGKDETRQFTTKLYQGNAYLIFIYHYEENGEKMYTLHTFFADKEHMKNCLGLNKKWSKDNIFNEDGYSKLVKISLDKNHNAYVKQIVDALVQANFSKLEITVYDSSKENK